ncbi:Uncharacterised protein [Moraxella caprae]|uniref:Uncharacterized protein n=1 Tax=Moraxella caprae TaxID=90240 RepID=A0A378U7P4_9GAMM|nr:Uncharacterised protein [Moraxella caprae]
MGAGNDTVKIEKNSYITTMTLGDGNDDLRMGGQLGNYSTIDAGMAMTMCIFLDTRITLL